MPDHFLGEPTSWAGRGLPIAGYMLVALAHAAYAAYLINAGQFVWKLRMARLDMARADAALARGAH